MKSGLYYAQRGYSRPIDFVREHLPDNAGRSVGVYFSVKAIIRRGVISWQVPLMANLSFRLADNVRLNLAAGPYIAYSMGDKNIAVYNEYTPGNSSSHESYGSIYYGGNGGYLYGGGWVEKRLLVMKVGRTITPFDWGLSFQAGLEIGSCDDECRLRCLFGQGIRI